MPLREDAPPENRFDNPIGLMRECHRRIEWYLDELSAIVAQARGGALAPLQRDTLEAALSYFADNASVHTCDEEVSLFPRMRVAGPEGAALLDTMHALEDDHRQVMEWHAELERLGRQWQQEGWLNREETTRLQSLLNEMRTHYRQHIAIEDHAIFPLATRLLSASEMEAIGREMAARRGLNYDHLRVPRVSPP
ncbi:MAG: hemerythrin domain-containing protein [Chloroherpetonaceae bacterium]|nr:hemerythrin domain-containing protein [Chthonomonadaceae bacterium]MDW8206507.1 hemerythrin domain-containing protein [Chloroherpetonaceae bacterium]